MRVTKAITRVDLASQCAIDTLCCVSLLTDFSMSESMMTVIVESIMPGSARQVALV